MEYAVELGALIKHIIKYPPTTGFVNPRLAMSIPDPRVRRIIARRPARAPANETKVEEARQCDS
jgi:hypothetical protein